MKKEFIEGLRIWYEELVWKFIIYFIFVSLIWLNVKDHYT